MKKSVDPCDCEQYNYFTHIGFVSAMHACMGLFLREGGRKEEEGGRKGGKVLDFQLSIQARMNLECF